MADRNIPSKKQSYAERVAAILREYAGTDQSDWTIGDKQVLALAHEADAALSYDSARDASLDELRRVLSAWPDQAAVFRPGIDWNVSDSATRPSLTAGDLRSVLDELSRLRQTVAQIGPDRLRAYEEDAGGAHETRCEVDGFPCDSTERCENCPTPETSRKSSRDADHCDYPDCEQHWTYVASMQRDLLEEWLRAFGSTDGLSQRTRAWIKNSPTETSAVIDFRDACDATGEPTGVDWIRVADRAPDHSEPVIYARPHSRDPGRWAVGIAYWTKSQRWNPEQESTCAPDGFTHWKPLGRRPSAQKAGAPTCSKHGVELAFEGDECWECKKERQL